MQDCINIVAVFLRILCLAVIQRHLLEKKNKEKFSNVAIGRHEKAIDRYVLTCKSLNLRRFLLCGESPAP